MNILLNLLWFVCGGFLSALGWFAAGIFWCCTIIGIPFGVQCFKLFRYSLAPFGKEIDYPSDRGLLLIPSGLWLLFGGFLLAVVNGVLSIVFYVTIIGIPFSRKYYEIALLCVYPFGAEIERE